jgi:hypothetical protein
MILAPMGVSKADNAKRPLVLYRSSEPVEPTLEVVLFENFVV